jgi:2-polyprenyl-6-methoxyphenol hydroxylase-like FAD-dependent oxidoreductase
MSSPSVVPRVWRTDRIRSVRLAILGGGPAGLLFALLVKRRHRAWTVEVFEQNAADATFGFGVVFSEGALAFLERDAPDFYAQLLPRMESWPVQRIVHRGAAIDIDGNGFSAIARLDLNRFLQDLCREGGVRLTHGRAIGALPELGAADLLVGADGLNSLVRRTLEAQFEPQVQWLDNRFAWYGTPQRFACLTLTFRESEHGAFVAHHYRYRPRMSTFIVECDAATWRRAGLDRMADAESRAYCEGVFAADLAGHALVSNKSVWRQFPILHNARWVARCGATPAVLIGDALRTIHFSIGSGTRLAFEDAIALDRAFGEAREDVAAALAVFERERRPVVEKLFAAAKQSSTWYEQFPGRMRRCDALGLAYDYMTRSGRMSDARLREQAPKFMARVDAWRGAGGPGSGSPT